MAVHQGAYNMAREEGKREALAGLQQAQQVQGAVDQAGQEGYNAGHSQGMSTGANEAAASIVAGLNGPQQSAPVQPQQQQAPQQFNPAELQEVAQAVVAGEVDEEDLDQMDAQHPGVKDAVLAMLQQQGSQGAPSEAAPQAGLNVA